MKKAVIVAASIGLLLLTLHCSDQGKSAITGIGTITYSGLEGGCWGVNMDQGNQYEIRDLPQAFRQEGLRVRIIAMLSRGQASYCYTSDGVIDINQIDRY